MNSFKSILIELSMLLASFILGAWLMGYFLAKSRDVENPVSYLLQRGTGEDWVQLSMSEKRDICAEVVRRFQTNEPKITVVYYYLYLEGTFNQPKLRSSLISDVFIEAEMRKLETQRKAKLSTEIPETIIWNPRLDTYIGLS